MMIMVIEFPWQCDCDVIALSVARHMWTHQGATSMEQSGRCCCCCCVKMRPPGLLMKAMKRSFTFLLLRSTINKRFCTTQNEATNKRKGAPINRRLLGDRPIHQKAANRLKGKKTRVKLIGCKIELVASFWVSSEKRLK